MWQPRPPLPHQQPSHGTLDVREALDAVPAGELTGGIRTRLAHLDQVPAALDALVDAAVTHYGRWAHGNPIMLVHAATAPRAIALTLPALPRHIWAASYQTAWSVTAAISAADRPPQPAADTADQNITLDEVAARAAESGDEHAIKFTEVAQESDRRGNTHALPAAARAVALIGAS